MPSVDATDGDKRDTTCDEGWMVVTPTLHSVWVATAGASSEETIPSETRTQNAQTGRTSQRGETRARVLHNFVAVAKNELSVVAGEDVWIVAKGDAGWWLARDAAGNLGWVPERYVKEDESGGAPKSEGQPSSTGEVDEEDELKTPWIAVTIGIRSVGVS